MMNTSTSTMFGGNGNQITVLERQQARIQQQQQQQSYFNEAHFNLLTLPPLSLPSTAEQLHGLITNESLVKVVVDPGMENGWSEFGKYPILRPGFGVETTGFGSVSNESVKNSAEMVDYSISRTTSCPPAVAESRVEIGVVRQGLNMKKRKADKAQSPKATVAEEAREKKRSKGSSDDESKVTEQSNINNNNNSSNITTITTTNNNNNNNNNNSKENSGDSSKENSKVFEPQKSDYIHVRARRGQATDSHSLAERVRREKISERMKYLQDLVPGCNKITGKAGMLDEIINYVQSLQRQVEFLSMKLATVNPRQDFNIDNFFPKEMYTACSGGFSSIGMSSEMENCSAYLPYNPVQQVVSCCGMDMVINPPDALRRTTSAPVSAPDALLDTSCFTQTNPTSSPWETDLQSLYNLEFNQARSTLFPPQSFTETMEANHLKMEL